MGDMITLHHGRHGDTTLWETWWHYIMGDMVTLHYGRHGDTTLWETWWHYIMGDMVAMENGCKIIKGKQVYLWDSSLDWYTGTHWGNIIFNRTSLSLGRIAHFNTGRCPAVDAATQIWLFCLYCVARVYSTNHWADSEYSHTILRSNVIITASRGSISNNCIHRFYSQDDHIWTSAYFNND